MKQPKLRISWSLMLMWKNQRYDDCVKMYLHKDMERTPQMEDGILWHKKWEKEASTGKLKIGAVTLKYEAPQPEHEIVVNFDEFFDLKCRMDCYDKPQKLFDEWKTGLQNSMTYALSGQVDFYFLINKIAGTPIDLCRLTHYNQYEDKADMTIIWYDEKMIEKAINMCQTLGGEIREYFLAHNIPFEKNT